jgi:hypothetical protein
MFSLLLPLSHPLPVGRQLIGRVQNQKTEYGFVEIKNGFICVSCGTSSRGRVIRQNENRGNLVASRG